MKKQFSSSSSLNKLILDNNINNNDNTPFSYQCNGKSITISTQFTLPVPISASYTTITYEFFTEGGDINFSILFIGYDNEEQTISQPSRVNSDSENIYGSCQIDCPGTIIFVWDNTYSWFNNKSLTYAIEIQQDDIESAKRPRVIESRKMISNLIHHKYEIQSKTNFVDEEISTLSTEVTDLEDTIWKLKQQLHYKKKVLKNYSMEKKDLTIVMEQCKKLTPAILIRTLNNYELASVLQFLDISITKLVCKYWYDICTYEYVEGREAPLTDYTEIDSLFKLPPLPSSLIYSNNTTSGHHSLPQEIIISSPTRHNHNHNTNTNHEEIENGHYHNNNNNNNNNHNHNGNNHIDEENKNIKENEEGREVGILKVEQDISSLSDDNHIGRSSVFSKKRNEIEKYLEEIITQKNDNEETILNGMNLLHKIEKEKLEVKGKIIQWKKQFEKKFQRQPSDEEKVKNIPGLFQKYSILNRRLIKEQKKLTQLIDEEKKKKREEKEIKNNESIEPTTTESKTDILAITTLENDDNQQLESEIQQSEQSPNQSQSQSQGKNDNNHNMDESDETSED